MTEDQQKIVVEVLQESASTARRAYQRYEQAALDNAEPAPASGGYLEHATACEAGIVLIRTLTPR